MHFLKSPITWILLALGIWLNCGYNFRVMQTQGVDAVTTPMLSIQALIGSVICVAIIVGLALLRGERLEADTGAGLGQLVLGGVIMVGVFIVGFLIVEPIINRVDPPARAPQMAYDPPPMRRQMRVRAPRPAQNRYQPVQPDDGRDFR